MQAQQRQQSSEARARTQTENNSLIEQDKEEDIIDFSQSARTRREHQFACLFTKHKTQKHKVWNDGRLIVKNNIICCLHDANPPPGGGDPILDQCELSVSQVKAITEQHETRVEMERFIIQIEGPWKSPTLFKQTNRQQQPLVSNRMQKVMKTKFRKPGQYIPPNPAQQEQKRRQALGKRRRRPLQPGELSRRYHGEPNPPPPTQQQQQYQQQQQCQQQQQQQQQQHSTFPSNQGLQHHNQLPVQQERPPQFPHHSDPPGQAQPPPRDDRRVRFDQNDPLGDESLSHLPQAQQPMHPSAHSTPAGAGKENRAQPAWARNGFNPSSFYESEEEEEAGEDELNELQPDSFSLANGPARESEATPPPTMPRRSSVPQTTPRTTNRTSASNHQENITNTNKPATQPISDKRALSRDELLQLFQDDDDDDNDATENDTPAPQSVDQMTQGAQQDNDTSQQAEPTNTETENQFRLVIESDSSSSEDEQG